MEAQGRFPSFDPIGLKAEVLISQRPRASGKPRLKRPGRRLRLLDTSPCRRGGGEDDGPLAGRLGVRGGGGRGSFLVADVKTDLHFFSTSATAMASPPMPPPVLIFMTHVKYTSSRSGRFVGGVRRVRRVGGNRITSPFSAFVGIILGRNQGVRILSE